MVALWVCVGLVWWPAVASAQLDPLLFVKRVPPTVIVVVDTSMRMLEDGDGNFYDPNTYTVADDLAAATALNVGVATTYRRIVKNLQFESVQDVSTKFSADDIVAVANTDPSYATFWDATRYEMAKAAIRQVVGENGSSLARWGLVKLRQSSPAWRVSPGCDKAVRVTNNAVLATASDSSPCNAGPAGRYAIYPATTNAASFSLETAPGDAVVVGAAANTTASVLAKVPAGVGGAGLIPASRGASTYEDRPISHALDDAKAQAEAAMSADSATFRARRNTVVVLVTGGKDSGDAAYTSTHDPTAIATTFQNVSASGTTKPVPIVVIAIKPNAGDEAQLETIAKNSGGRYFLATSAAEASYALSYAVQLGYGRASDFDLSLASEFHAVSPIVGTVNLKNASSSTGGALSNTDITTNPGGEPIPQRSNLLLTAGFALPGYEGRLRAFRTFVPVADATRPSGWKFVKDGTPLWPDLDGRPQLANLARTPASADDRNIFTFIPDGAGGGSVVAFTAANAVTIAPHLGDLGSTTATELISFVRSQPLGAVIGSTPAIMDPPSLDPPPDDDYGRSDAVGTFAGDHKNRRSMIWFGANDGMIHGVDARTGYEVWAFIPYNLLPKLRTLVDGQPLEQYDFFVDSSPKIAEVKMNGTTWKSLLIIGQAGGGTFYQALDVTEAGMGVDPATGDLGAVSALLNTFQTPDVGVTFLWAFPNYSSFDPTYYAEFSLSDGTAGGKLRMYGDLKGTATSVEKTVGFTWSDPAVGPLDNARAVNAVIVGSGYFPPIEDLIAGRGPGAPRAGQAYYLLDVTTGRPIGNPGGCAAVPGAGTGCLSLGDPSNGRKNAVQADPTAAADWGMHVVNRAYVGDTDGRYWRFSLTSAGSITASQMIDTGQPIYGSSALLFVGSAEQYMFFATGSDLLPVTAGGGTGTFKLYGLRDNYPAAGATLKFSLNLSAVTDSGGYAVGEQPSSSPSVAGDIAFFTTSVWAADGTLTSNLYGLTFLGGAAYDSSGNDRIDKNESPIVRTVGGRATAPFIVDQHLYFGTVTETGVNVEIMGDPEDFNNGVGQVGVRILSWREIR